MCMTINYIQVYYTKFYIYIHIKLTYIYVYSSVYNLYTTYIYKRYIHIIHYSYTILCMSIFKYLLKMTLSLSECYIVLPNHMSMWKVQFFRKTIIRSTISHYDFYTNKSLLGGRSAQFVVQFYNKRNNKKKIDYRLSRIEIDLISNWGS